MFLYAIFGKFLDLISFYIYSAVPEYEVIMPYQHPKQRFRRSLSREDDFQEDDKLLITLPIKGQDRLITLRQKRYQFIQL